MCEHCVRIISTNYILTTFFTVQSHHLASKRNFSPSTEIGLLACTKIARCFSSNFFLFTFFRQQLSILAGRHISQARISSTTREHSLIDVPPPRSTTSCAPSEMVREMVPRQWIRSVPPPTNTPPLLVNTIARKCSLNLDEMGQIE